MNTSHTLLLGKRARQKRSPATAHYSQSDMESMYGLHAPAGSYLVATTPPDGMDSILQNYRKKRLARAYIPTKLHIYAAPRLRKIGVARSCRCPSLPGATRLPSQADEMATRARFLMLFLTISDNLQLNEFIHPLAHVFFIGKRRRKREREVKLILNNKHIFIYSCNHVIVKYI